MVEGHSVHRIASRFRERLVGRRFLASSPNGRFSEGAAAIDGRVFSDIEAVGKNLFAFFERDAKPTGDDEAICCHVHFGMSGVWSLHEVSNEEDEPEPKATCRLRLEEISGDGASAVTHLSCMTLTHGGMELYSSKRALLGEDPLRSDADPDKLYGKIAKMGAKGGGRCVGRLLMDQALFAGPGNIYRAEILFLAGVDPETSAADLSREEFDRVWRWSVELLRRGYDTGSILTVDARLDPETASRGIRRYVYNRAECGRCGGQVLSWDMAGRTCYACGGGCQGTISPTTPLQKPKRNVKKETKDSLKGDTSKKNIKKEIKASLKRDTSKKNIKKETKASLKKETKDRLKKESKDTVKKEYSAAGANEVMSNPECLPATGSRVEIYWPMDDAYYPGIVSLSKRKQNTRIHYDDGEFEDLNLLKEVWRYEANQPAPPNRPDVKRPHVPFISHCARDRLETRLLAHGPRGLTVAEIRQKLNSLRVPLPPKGASKSAHVEALRSTMGFKETLRPVTAQVKALRSATGEETLRSVTAQAEAHVGHLPPPTVSAEDAAREKAAAGEHRGVEHVAELSSGQAVRASTRVVTPESEPPSPNTRSSDKKRALEQKRVITRVRRRKLALPPSS